MIIEDVVEAGERWSKQTGSAYKCHPLLSDRLGNENCAVFLHDMGIHNSVHHYRVMVAIREDCEWVGHGMVEIYIHQELRATERFHLLEKAALQALDEAYPVNRVKT